MCDFVKFIKRKLMFLIAVTGLSYALLGTGLVSFARDNAYLACFIDDTSNMFKTQVVFSGQEIEAQRTIVFRKGIDLSHKNNSIAGGTGDYLIRDNDSSGNTINASDYEDTRQFLILDKENTKLPIMGTDGNFVYLNQKAIKTNSENYFFKFTIEKGLPKLLIDDRNSLNQEGMSADSVGSNDAKLEPTDFPWAELDDSALKGAVTPLTFPADTTLDARNSDINRAYEVQDALSEDFRNALLFINGGKSYEDVNTLLETAYYLVNSNPSGITRIRNPQGDVYSVKHIGLSNTTPYKYEITISEYDEKTGKNYGENRKYCFKVKKGYLNCSSDDVMETGTYNNLTSEKIAENTEKTDTTWISWEHLYFEAALLYSQGITYSNQADLYAIDRLESGIVGVCRSLLNGLKGILQFYSLEDLIFNKGIRGGRAFVYGAYYDNWSAPMMIMFLVFMAIALSLVLLSIITLIGRKQMSVMSPTARVSLIEGVKDMVLALLLLAFVWIITKVLLMLNFRYVDVWSAYVGEKTLENYGGSYSVLASVVFQFAYFVVDMYANFMYITRSLFIAALIIMSPIFIIAFTFGPKGQEITRSWFKELVGHIFIQSFHATIFALVITASPGLRGIESLVVCTSIIPLTSLIKDIFGLGLDNLAHQAAVLTGTGTAVMGSTAKVAADVTAKGVETVSTVIGAGAGALGAAAGAGTGGSSGSFGGGSGGGAASFGAKIGKGIGSGMGKIAGSGIRMAGSGFSAGSGLGYNLGVREYSPQASQSIRDAGKDVERGMIGGMEDLGLTNIEAAASKYDAAQQEKIRNTTRRPPRQYHHNTYRRHR